MLGAQLGQQLHNMRFKGLHVLGGQQAAQAIVAFGMGVLAGDHGFVQGVEQLVAEAVHDFNGNGTVDAVHGKNGGYKCLGRLAAAGSHIVDHHAAQVVLQEGAVAELAVTDAAVADEFARGSEEGVGHGHLGLAEGARQVQQAGL